MLYYCSIIYTYDKVKLNTMYIKYTLCNKDINILYILRYKTLIFNDQSSIKLQKMLENAFDLLWIFLSRSFGFSPTSQQSSNHFLPSSFAKELDVNPSFLKKLARQCSRQAWHRGKIGRCIRTIEHSRNIWTDDRRSYQLHGPVGELEKKIHSTRTFCPHHVHRGCDWSSSDSWDLGSRQSS